MFPHQALPQQFPSGGGYCILTGPASSPAVAGFLMVEQKGAVNENYYATLNFTLPYTLPSGHVWIVENSSTEWDTPEDMVAWVEDQYPSATVETVRIDERYNAWP